MKETKELRKLTGTDGNGEGEVDPFGDAQGENSRPMIAWIKLTVNYYYSTSIWQVDAFVRKIMQEEENKGVELTVPHDRSRRRHARMTGLGDRFHQPSRRAVGILAKLAGVIEDHCGHLIGVECGPFREAGMVGVAMAGEAEPGAADFVG